MRGLRVHSLAAVLVLTIPLLLLAQPSFELLWQELYLESEQEIGYRCHGMLDGGDSLLLYGYTWINEENHPTIPLLLWLSPEGQYIDTNRIRSDHYVGTLTAATWTDRGTLFLSGNHTDSLIEHYEYLTFAAEVTPGGELLWDTTFGMPGADHTWPREVCRTTLGEYVIVGSVDGLHPSFYVRNYWWARFDAQGQLLEQDTVQFNPTLGDFNQALAVAPTLDGGVVLGGSSDRASGAELVKLSVGGDREWYMFTGGQANHLTEIDALTVLPTGEIVVAGSLRHRDLAYNYDINVEMYSPTGQRLWRTYLPQLQPQRARDVLLSAENRLVVLVEGQPVTLGRNEGLLSLNLEGQALGLRQTVSDYYIDLGGLAQRADSGFVVGGAGFVFEGNGLYWPRYYSAGYGPDRSAFAPPAAFALLEPAPGDTVTADSVCFVWQTAVDPNPLDTVRYTLTVRAGADSLVWAGLVDTVRTVPAAELLALGGEKRSMSGR